jgi:hypothetical protein
MKRINAILAAGGLCVLVFLATKVGWVGLSHQLKALETGSLLLILFGLLRLSLQTAAWSSALRAQGIRSRTWDLIWIRLAAQSLGYLSMFGPAIAEPMKIRLLAKSTGSCTVATLADASTYGFTSCLFGILGCMCAVLIMVQSRHLTPMLILAAGLILGAVLFVRTDSLLEPLGRRLGARSPRWLLAGMRIEGEIRQFIWRHRKPVWRMFLLGLGCQILLAADIVVVFWCLRIPFHAATVLALEAASRAARMMSGWIPARMGADEAGAVAAFAAFGLPSASGLVLALSRRVRDLVLSLLGIGLLLWSRTPVPALSPCNLIRS